MERKKAKKEMVEKYKKGRKTRKWGDGYRLYSGKWGIFKGEMGDTFQEMGNIRGIFKKWGMFRKMGDIRGIYSGNGDI